MDTLSTVFDDIDGLLLMTGRMFQFKETFIEITKLLKKSLGENHPSNGYKPQVTFEASQYVAVFDEGIWKRAYVEEVNTQNYQVQLIDYGKSDIIPEKRVKEQVFST